MATRWLRQSTVPQLFRQAWNEIPEVMGAGVCGLIGCGLICYQIYTHYQVPGRQYRTFKMACVVVRPNDPYVKYLYNRDTPETRAAHEKELELYTLSPYNR